MQCFISHTCKDLPKFPSEKRITPDSFIREEKEKKKQLEWTAKLRQSEIEKKRPHN